VAVAFVRSSSFAVVAAAAAAVVVVVVVVVVVAVPIDVEEPFVVVRKAVDVQ
jgi:type IV secretory pathway component VirB8